ncbi:hypothetical protein DBL07_21175 [Achromobacter mucicolens]|nr:hypothetical protein DBL07_21175 [Achromobacter mucicolens]
MLSRSVALAPGDLVHTGAPAGVGPLAPGDVVSAGVADIGALTLTVAALAPPDGARRFLPTPIAIPSAPGVTL